MAWTAEYGTQNSFIEVHHDFLYHIVHLLTNALTILSHEAWMPYWKVFRKSIIILLDYQQQF